MLFFNLRWPMIPIQTIRRHITRKRAEMNTKPLRKVLFIVGIPLLLASCGERQKETPGEISADPTVAPKVLPSILKIKRHSKTYVITGIGLSGSNKVAIINNQVVKPGMEIDPGVVLKDVQPTFAVILEGNTRHLLRPENIQAELDQKKQ